MQRYDRIDCAEVPQDAPIRFHHTIENRSGTGVQVRLQRAKGDSLRTGIFPLVLVPEV